MGRATEGRKREKNSGSGKGIRNSVFHLEEFNGFRKIRMTVDYCRNVSSHDTFRHADFHSKNFASKF